MALREVDEERCHQQPSEDLFQRQVLLPITARYSNVVEPALHPECGGANAIFTTRVNAAGGTVSPKPARLNSCSWSYVSLKAALGLSLSAVVTWWDPDARSTCVK